MNTPDANETRDDAMEVGTESSSQPVSWQTAIGRIALKGLKVVLVLFLLAAGIVWYAYRSAHKLPEFYQTSLTAPIDVLEDEGKEFESRIFDLQSESHEAGQWQATFTENQVNGWLAIDLPEKFPQALPRQIANPRIRISDDELELAFQCQSRRFNGIIVARGDAFCTEHPNEIAIRIKSAKAGIVPLPIGPWVNAIAQSLRQAGSKTTWSEIEGDPTAIVKLPKSITEMDDRIFKLENVQLTEGQLFLGGVTIDADELGDLQVEEK